MRKKDELSHPDSCINRAGDDEMTFVLLGRDKASAATLRFWIEERIRLGKNQRDDPRIVEAESCARIMEEQSEQDRVTLDGPNSLKNVLSEKRVVDSQIEGVE